MRRSTMKILIVILLILDLILFTVVLKPFDKEQKEPALQATEAFAPVLETAAEEPEQTQAPADVSAETVPAETAPPETTLPSESFQLTFVGDCTLGSSVGTYYAGLGFIKTVGDDLEYPLANVRSYFEEDDFTMVNLEGVLADRGSPIYKDFNFRGPVKYGKILSQGSVEAVTLANNHSYDYGKKGYQSTITVLEEEGISYVERDEIAMFTTERGLKIGLYAMMYANLDVEDMLQGIAELQEKGAELIVVAAHWGIEGDYLPNDEQVNVGRAAIDAGAHIVYGSHPHVLQPIEEYGDGVIYYSLGNFAFGGNGAPKDMDSVILRQEVIRRGDGTVILGQREEIPVCVSSVSDKNNYQPTPYEEGSGEYDRVLSKLDGTFE